MNLILEIGSTKNHVDYESTTSKITEDGATTTMSSLNQDNNINSKNISTEEHIEESSQKSNLSNDVKITTSSSVDDSIAYDPNKNGENKNENGDSIQINIHLIEKTENNRSSNIQISLQLFFISFFIIARSKWYFTLVNKE